MAVSLGRQAWPYEPIALPIRLRAHATLLERDIEEALAKRLAFASSRQLECHGHKPDLVLDGGSVVTIVEIKRDVAGDRSVAQITRYVEHWAEHLAAEDGRFIVYGILAAPRIRASTARRLPTWCAFAPLELRVSRGRA